MKWLYELDKLKILGKTYAVIYEGNPYFEPDVQPEVKMGLCDRTEQKIHIYKGQPPEAMLDVLLHEVLHAIEGEMCIKFQEDDVSRLGAALQAFFMDNFTLGRKK